MEIDNTMEKNRQLSQFIEKIVDPQDPDRCVDGRQDPASRQGYQLLGGDAHPIFLKSIEQNTPFNEQTIRSDLHTLKAGNVPLGFHRGSHKNLAENLCDCGACDKLHRIIEAAKEKRELITQRLKSVFELNVEILPDFSIVEAAYEKVNTYDMNNIQISGDSVIKIAEEEGANVESLQSDHAERQAFINLKAGITLDTKQMNENQDQAFNLDLQAAIQRANLLGVDEAFSTGASIILYQATEMVLVEEKGKPALPVVLHR